MTRPFSVFVGLRYTLTRKNNFLLSFVSLISMLGVTLGVMILIVALSVMNGSISRLREEALKSVPHVTVSGSPVTQDWSAQAAVAIESEQILAAAPFLQGEANILYQGQNQFVSLRGVDAELEGAVVDNPSSRYQELLAALAETENGIILGTQLAGSLGIYNSAEISITALNSLLARNLSDVQGFRVVGFADFGFYSNSDTALINLAQAQSLFEQDPGTDLQLRLKVADVFAAEAVANDALGSIAGIDIQPWNETQASLFDALEMEKLITSFMLMMIVIVGAVNIVSTLVMVVADKGADIAILRTMGASKGTVMKIFITQGLVAGVFGTVVGAGLGILLAFSISDISLLLERLINSVFTDANVYLISQLQTQVDYAEVLLVCLAALAVSFLATLYPAYRASKIQPAEVLRYE